nr:hypothetical protein [candidate division Zixibacteria bacterium]
MAAKKKAKPKAKAKAKPKAKAKARGKKPVGKAWSAAEIQSLRTSYKSKPASQIAKELRRSLASVRGKISALNLTKPAAARKAKPKPKKKAAPKKAAPKKAKAKAKARPKKKAAPRKSYRRY